MRYLKFIIFFVGLSFINQVKEDLYYAYQSSSWAQIQGVVIESVLRTKPPEKDQPQTFVPDVVYRYELSDKKYKNNRISFERTFKDKALAKGFVDRYPKGKQVTVFYNPGNPAQSILEPGIKFSALVTTCVGAFMALFSFILFNIKRFLKKFLAGLFMIHAGGAMMLGQGSKIMEGSADISSLSSLFFNGSGAALVYAGYRLCRPLVLDLWSRLRGLKSL